MNSLAPLLIFCDALNKEALTQHKTFRRNLICSSYAEILNSRESFLAESGLK